jgi:hypothetical protein
MKIQVTVTKSGTISNQADFPSQEEAQAWLDSHIGMGTFGSPRFEMRPYQLQPAEYERRQVEVAEGVFEEQQVEISPAVFEDRLAEVNPAGYEIEQEDTSAAEAQAAINAASLKYLAETDWQVLRHLRQLALEIQTTLSSEEYLQLEQSRSEAAEKIIK